MLTCYKKRTLFQFDSTRSNELIKEQHNFIIYDERLELKNEDDKFEGVFTVYDQ